MKKNILFCLITLVFISCNSRNDNFIFKQGLIKTKGTYITSDNKIIIKEFKNGSLIYAIANKNNEILKQQSIMQAFNKNSYWSLYFDGKENLWFYSSDLNITKVWLKDKLTNSYEEFNFCLDKINLPEEFEDELNTNVSEYCDRYGLN